MASWFNPNSNSESGFSQSTSAGGGGKSYDMLGNMGASMGSQGGGFQPGLSSKLGGADMQAPPYQPPPQQPDMTSMINAQMAGGAGKNFSASAGMGGSPGQQNKGGK